MLRLVLKIHENVTISEDLADHLTVMYSSHLVAHHRHLAQEGRSPERHPEAFPLWHGVVFHAGHHHLLDSARHSDRVEEV